MKIHFISTINGLENEGMRNVATHLAREFEKKHTVTYSALKSVFSTVKNGRKSDVTFVFARAIKSVYYMLRLVRPFVKNICLCCVQPVSCEFAALNKKHRVVDSCLTICESDVAHAFEKNIVHRMDVGINAEKFSPLTENDDVNELRKQLGLPTDKTVVLHVGHCSSGRFLEEMLTLDKEKYHCVVIARGMFDDENTIKALKDGSVDLRFGFVEHIEDFYRCADAYFFPTKSSEFVISIPLSCMEALSCGLSVVCYNSFEKMELIKTDDYNAFVKIDSLQELSMAIDKAKENKRDKSYLKDPKSWEVVAQNALSALNLE